jgi:hypothetical protein
MASTGGVGREKLRSKSCDQILQRLRRWIRNMAAAEKVEQR